MTSQGLDIYGSRPKETGVGQCVDDRATTRIDDYTKQDFKSAVF